MMGKATKKATKQATNPFFVVTGLKDNNQHWKNVDPTLIFLAT